jgi:hypothetical protein
MRVTCDAPMLGGNLRSSVVAMRHQRMRRMLGSLNMAADLGTKLFVVHSGHVGGNQVPTVPGEVHPSATGSVAAPVSSASKEGRGP